MSRKVPATFVACAAVVAVVGATKSFCNKYYQLKITLE